VLVAAEQQFLAEARNDTVFAEIGLAKKKGSQCGCLLLVLELGYFAVRAGRRCTGRLVGAGFSPAFRSSLPSFIIIMKGVAV
jgi:hypothetical protein